MLELSGTVRHWRANVSNRNGWSLPANNNRLVPEEPPSSRLLRRESGRSVHDERDPAPHPRACSCQTTDVPLCHGEDQQIRYNQCDRRMCNPTSVLTSEEGLRASRRPDPVALPSLPHSLTLMVCFCPIIVPSLHGPSVAFSVLHICKPGTRSSSIANMLAPVPTTALVLRIQH